MQFQIVRNSQFTNSRVNKFKPSVSPLCSYCGTDVENISHLYFVCALVKTFWFDIQGWLNQLSVIFPLNINYILFGYEKEPSSSRINLIILIAKRYIWTNKFNSTPLSLIAFQNLLKSKLSELKDCYEYVEKPDQFNHLLSIYNAVQ